MTNEAKIRKVAGKTRRMLDQQGALGTMGLHLSSEAWKHGEIEPLVKCELPREMTPQQAKDLGWALFWLGKYGLELMDAEDHEIPDEEYFAG